jgi:predicted porin
MVSSKTFSGACIGRFGGNAALKLFACTLAVGLPGVALAQTSETAPSSTQSASSTPEAKTAASKSAASGKMQGSKSKVPVTPELQFTAAVDLNETYTSNAQGIGGATNAPDYFTQGALNLGLHYRAPRFLADGNYALTGDLYAEHPKLDNLVNNLNLLGSGEVIPDAVFLDVRGFAAPISLSRVGALSADAQPVSDVNTRDSFGYEVRPDYKFNLGDYFSSDAFLTQGGIFFVQPSTVSVGAPLPFDAPQNTLMTSLTERITSGTWFSRLQWSLNGSGTETNQNSQTQKESAGLFNAGYAITRQFALLASVGYQTYDSSIGLLKKLDGITAIGGAHITFGSDFDFTVNAGQQYNFPVITGQLTWAVGPSTSILASATDTVTTPQERLLGNLGSLSTTPDGTFYDVRNQVPGAAEITQLPLPEDEFISPLSTDGLSVDNAISRYRSVNASFVHQQTRTNYRLTLFGTIQNRLSFPVPVYGLRQSSYGASADAAHQLTRHLTASGEVSYSMADEFGGHDRILNTNAGLAYTATEKLTFYVRGIYLHRDSHNLFFPELPLSDVEVTIGVRRAF